MTGHLQVMVEMQQRKPQYFWDYNMFLLRDRRMQTAQYDILNLNEEFHSVAYRGRDGLANIVCLLCIDNL